MRYCFMLPSYYYESHNKYLPALFHFFIRIGNYRRVTVEREIINVYDVFEI